MQNLRSCPLLAFLSLSALAFVTFVTTPLADWGDLATMRGIRKNTIT